VKDPGDWMWSSFRHYALREMGVVEIESECTVRDREVKASFGKEGGYGPWDMWAAAGEQVWVCVLFRRTRFFALT
jgi:hypothetical protein